MLAICRALLSDPALLVMDEPTEGLAPAIVAQVEELLQTLARTGETTILLIEQNIGVATAVSERVAIMLNGRINRVMDAKALAADRGLQQRLLGVGRHSEPTARPGRRSLEAPSEIADAGRSDMTAGARAKELDSRVGRARPRRAPAPPKLRGVPGVRSSKGLRHAVLGADRQDGAGGGNF